MKKYLMGLVLSAIAATGAMAQPKELVVAAFGGAYTDALKKHMGAFEAANNVKVRFLPASGAEAISKARGKEVDVIHADFAWAFRGEAQGLFEKLDPAVIPNLATVYPRARFSDYGVVTNFGEYGIAYNKKLVTKPPTSWSDMLDPQYKGRVSTAGFDAANAEMLVMFAKANGGSEDNIDPGFKKMAEMSKNITVFYSQHPQLLDLFRSGEVVMARWLRGRVKWANEKDVTDVQFAVPKEGAIALASTVHVVKGRQNTQLAMKFINYLLSKECQVEYARDLGYTPSRSDLDLKAQNINVPYGNEMINSLIIGDWRKITPKLDSWKERWDKEIGR